MMRVSTLLTVAAVSVTAALLALAGPAAARAPVSYSTPGYHGTHKVPKVTQRALPPVTIGVGQDPSILVDAAGTSHIVWDRPVAGGADQLHYCRLPRGAKACAVSSVLAINQPDVLGNSLQTNTDNDGPRPLAVGNELLVLSNRSPNVVPVPGCNEPDPGDCPTSDSNDYLFTSEDGGESFGAPGVIGTNGVAFGAVTFGAGSPFIGTLSSEPGQGLVFQATHAGQFAPATDAVSFGDVAAGGNGSCCLLAVDPTTQRPVIALGTDGGIVVREWDGTGSPNASSQWTTSPSFPGAGQPAIAAGPSGVFVAADACASCGKTIVRKVTAGGAGPAVSLGSSTNNLSLAEDAGGGVHALYSPETATNGQNQLLLRSSADGTRWTAPQLLAQSSAGGENPFVAPRTGAAPDGGGAVVWESAPGGDGRIEVAGFGPTAPTQLPGLGSLAGGSGPLGGDPGGASTSCTDIHMGDIDAISQAGCFLRDPQHPSSGAAVTDGEFRLNGLQIIPDAGVRSVIDPRSRTINTTGSVSVVLRGLGIGDITLWHGELHVKLDSAASGQTLFDFDTSQFAAALKGFPIDGKIDVVLEHDAVKIPISLKLPPYLGGVTGQATLLANNREGLVLDSLQIDVPDVILGALEIKDLNVSYTRDGDVWTGGAKFNIPPHTGEFAIDVQVRFDRGELTMGSFGFGFYPGIPVFTDLYLNHFGGGFDLRSPKRIFGDVSVGAIPLDPPNYAINVDGTFSITFGENGSPTIIQVGGTGAVHGEEIANAKLIFQTNGYFEAEGNVDVDLSVLEVQGGIKAFADLPAKLFSGDVHGSVSVGGIPLASAESLIANTGMGACGSLHILPFPAIAGGFFWAWGTSADDVHFEVGSCDLSQYKVTPVSASASRVSGRATSVSAVTVPSRAPLEDIELLGLGGAPSVVLTSPSGRQIIPSTSDIHALAYVLTFAHAGRAVVVLNHPQPGAWRVSPAPGSVPLRRVQAASGYAPPRVRAVVRGTGRRRRLSYQVSGGAPELRVAFADQAGRVYRVIGTGHGSRGTIGFAPADGSAGRRTIMGLITENGLPRAREIVARYTAPGPLRPGRVKSLRVRRLRGSFRVSFGRAGNAAQYLVRIDASDGRRVERLIGDRGHRLTVRSVGYFDHVRVAVVGVSATGRHGPVTRGTDLTKRHRRSHSSHSDPAQT